MGTFEGNSGFYTKPLGDGELQKFYVGFSSMKLSLKLKNFVKKLELK